MTAITPKVDYASGAILTAAQMNQIGNDLDDLPFGCLYRGSVTSDQGSITTITDLTGLGSTTIAQRSGRTYRTTAYLAVSSSVANDIALVSIRSASATLATCRFQLVRDGNGFHMFVQFHEAASSTATVTRKLSLERAFGTGTLTMVASATSPCQFMVEDMGPTP